MYMSRFGVKNYKCLAEVDIPLTPIHVLIGPNDAGKTSLLEAMVALYQSADCNLPDVFPKPWNGRELVFGASHGRRVEVCGNWRADPAREPEQGAGEMDYGITVEFQANGNTCQCRSEVVSAARAGRFETKCDIPHTPLCNFRRERTRPVEGNCHSFATSAVSKVLKSTKIYAFNPKLMAVPAAIDIERTFRLDRDGFGLPALLTDILGYDAALFVGLRTEFCRLFPQFTSVRVKSENAVRRGAREGIPTVEGEGIGAAIYLELKSGATIRAQQVSDGAILMLGFLALAHLPDPPTLLLIEEPENGIYPKRLGEVIQMLKQMVGRTEGVRFPQIIMTTHSPYVLSFFEPEEVTFLSRDPKKPEAGVRARPLRNAPNIRERLGGGAFYLGELWYNLSEEELFGEP